MGGHIVIQECFTIRRANRLLRNTWTNKEVLILNCWDMNVSMRHCRLISIQIDGLFIWQCHV